MKVFLIYIVLGGFISLKAAPVSWGQLIKLKGVGNIPFWVIAWPWPVAAQIVKSITGDYPKWAPNL